jgi:hypothetical protein
MWNIHARRQGTITIIIIRQSQIDDIVCVCGQGLRIGFSTFFKRTATITLFSFNVNHGIHIVCYYSTVLVFSIVIIITIILSIIVAAYNYTILHSLVTSLPYRTPN